MQKELYSQEDLSQRESAFDQQAITGMWDRMKSLESKYIDLANYYKQELLQTKNGTGVLDTSNSSKSAVGGVITPAQQPGTPLSEDQIINDLKSEKIRFEQNIKVVLEKAQFGGSEVTMSNDEMIRLNNEIQGAFSDVLDLVDQTQSQSVQCISQRQTEMFQLTTKYRLPSGFKNDAVGVWYDAKTGVTQALQKLRQFVEEKGIAVMAQTVQPKSSLSDNVQKKEDYTTLIKRFEQDMVMLKQGSKDYNQSIQMIKQALSENEKNLARDKEVLSRDYKSLMESLEDVLGGGKVDIVSQASRGQASSGSGVMSPFDKKINSFGTRSGSRGPQQKPPKLSYQQSAMLPKASPLRNKNIYFDINDVHPDLRAMRKKLVQYDASIEQYLSNQEFKEKKIAEIMSRVEYQVQNNVMKFIATHDVDLVRQYFTNTVLTPTETAQILAKANLDAHSAQQKLQSSASSQNLKRQSISPYRGSIPGTDLAGYRKSTTPTRSKSKLQSIRTPSKDFGSSGRFQATGESIRLQELQSNTESLFNELRKANDKCIESQVENRKLKDKIQVLSLQMEDLRIHNNRYQMQAAGSILKPKKTKTTRTGASPYRVMDGPSAGISIVSGGDIGEEIELCKRIDVFFTAMKLLQRAVNKKEDISELKVEFESKQRSLQKLSKHIQSQKKDISQYMGSEPSVVNENLQTLKNRSQSSRGLGTSSNRPTTSFRGTTSPMRPNTTNMISPKPSNRADQNSDLINIQKQTINSLEQQLYNKKNEQAKIVAQIKNFESYQKQNLQNLQNRLEEREVELDSVKSLFVERLRELETNFAEIGDHLIANQEQKQVKQPEAMAQTQNSLQKFMIDDSSNQHAEDEKAIEELTQTNSQLHDQINDLKRQFKAYVDPKEHQALKQELNSFDQQIRMLQKEKLHLVKMFDVLSKERDTSLVEFSKIKQDKSLLQTEISTMTSQIQNSKLEKEEQEMVISDSIKKIQQQLKDEVEQKLCYQKEARDNENLVKILEEENEGFQSQMVTLEMERAQLDQEVKSLKDDTQELESEVAMRKEQIDETEEQLMALKEELKARAEELEESQEMIEKLEEELRDSSKDKADPEEIVQLKKRIEQLQEESDQLEEACQMKQDELDQAQEVLEMAEESSKKKLEDAEIFNKGKLMDAEILSKNKIQEAENSSQKKLEEAEIASKKELEDVEISSKKMLDDAEKVNKEILEEVQANNTKISQTTERKNWWMSALQLRVKRILEQKIEQQSQEVKLIQQQLQSKELGDSDQIKQLTQSESELRKQLYDEMSQSKQEIEMMKTEINIENDKKVKEIAEIKKIQSEELIKIEEKQKNEAEKVKTDHEAEIKKIKKAMEGEVKNLQKYKKAEIDNVTKAKEGEIKNLKQGQDVEIKNIKKAQKVEIETIKKDKDAEIETIINAKEAEIENIKKSQEAEIENIIKDNEAEIENIKKAKDTVIENIRKAKDVEIENLKLAKESEFEILQKSNVQQIENLNKSEQESKAQIQSEKDTILASLKENLSLQIEQKEEEITELKLENERLWKNIDVQSSKNEVNLKEIGQQKVKLEEQKKLIDDLDKSSSLDEQLSLMEEKLDQKENEITKLNDQNDDFDLKISEQNQEIEEKIIEIEDLQEKLKDIQGKMEVDTELVTMLLAEKKEFKESAIEMENIIETLEKENEVLNSKQEENIETQSQLSEAQKDLYEASNQLEEYEKLQAQSEDELSDLKKIQDKQSLDLNSAITQLTSDLKITTEKLQKSTSDFQNCQNKLDELHDAMSQKVDSGHNSVKQIVDIHKTNEQLSEQLLAKVEQNKKLDQDLESQRTAYEVLLDQLSKLEYSETTLMDQVKELEATIEEMQADNKKSSGISRASIGSDDEYQTVSEMKDHLNHARQILIQFIVKVPFSSPENEATLPIIFSMFEFSKKEQEKVTEARMIFNQDKNTGEVKEKSKKMFGSFMPKRKTLKTDQSFNSGGTNTNESQGK